MIIEENIQNKLETIPAKTILIRNKGTNWFGYDYNMNLYKGCNHGCIYCDSRSDCYQIENFSKVRIKQDALAILRDNLAHKVKTGVVATGAMSDPYNPFEKDGLYTRHSLELLNAYGFGAAIATKSDLITRDIDILKDIRSHSPVLCKITITTADDALAAKLEPGASSPSKRFAALQKLSEAGIPCGILLMPVLPYLEDTEENITNIIQGGLDAGIQFIYPAFGLTMRSGQREYFYNKLESLFPGQNLKEKYSKKFGSKYYCSSPKAKQLWSVFTTQCEKTGLLYKMPEIIRRYKQGYQTTQLSFF